MNPRSKLGIIGCGQMAGALVAGITAKNNPFAELFYFDIDIMQAQNMAAQFGGIVTASASELAEKADVILIAVKPAQAIPVVNQISRVLKPDHLLISVAAGISLPALTAAAGANIPIVRAMPNTACLMGMGATAVSFNQFVSGPDQELVLNLMGSVGKSWAVAEEYMDGVTAVSGSGPAYLFLVAEAMMDAAVAIGLSWELARDLVNQTLAGSAVMLKESGEAPRALRERVTSPGGTTAAALKALESGGIRAAFFAAIEAARLRAKDLGR